MNLTEIEEYDKGCHFVVTGLFYNSTRRFSNTYSSRLHAYGINLWRGSVWRVDGEGKRKLVRRVYN